MIKLGNVIWNTDGMVPIGEKIKYVENIASVPLSSPQIFQGLNWDRTPVTASYEQNARVENIATFTVGTV